MFLLSILLMSYCCHLKKGILDWEPDRKESRPRRRRLQWLRQGVRIYKLTWHHSFYQVLHAHPVLKNSHWHKQRAQRSISKSWILTGLREERQLFVEGNQCYTVTFSLIWRYEDRGRTPEAAYRIRIFICIRRLLFRVGWKPDFPVMHPLSTLYPHKFWRNLIVFLKN